MSFQLHLMEVKCQFLEEFLKSLNWILIVLQLFVLGIRAITSQM